MKSMEESTPLTCAIEGEDIVIRIGIPPLMWALQHETVWESQFGITDPEAFSKAIVKALNEDDEEGTTLVHRMFDSAADAAMAQGCEGVEVVSDDDYLA